MVVETVFVCSDVLVTYKGGRFAALVFFLLSTTFRKVV